jgi:hypothetical protein
MKMTSMEKKGKDGERKRRSKHFNPLAVESVARSPLQQLILHLT